MRLWGARGANHLLWSPPLQQNQQDHLDSFCLHVIMHKYEGDV